ncbi:DUF4184 family protein [Streptomyces sp. NBC_01007]|nr:DUF4184 family protein [Streptomyces sp. NBC_01007]
MRHRWYVTVISAWLGAVTHGLWDDFTHDGLAGRSLGFAVLGRPMVPGIPWWIGPAQASMLVGIVGWVWATVPIGRRGLMSRWHGSPPRGVVRPVLFWAPVAVKTTLGTVASALFPDGRIPVVFFERFLCVFAGALMLTAAVVVPLADYVTRYVVLRRSVPSRPSMFDESNGTNGVEGTE